MGAIYWTLAILAAAPAGAEPVHALILSGKNNHAWQETTPVLRQILEQSGRFTVEVTEHPETMTAESIAPFDVIVSNWNTWPPDAPGVVWPPATKIAFLDFVRRGKGFVSVHAGSSSFYDWEEYQQLVITSWKLGETGHGQQHTFRVTATPEDHPITRGLPSFTIFDELWHRAPIQPGAQVLATAYSSKAFGGTDREEPVVMVRDFGKGRSANILLGHHAQAMNNSSFGVLFARAAEWAATGKVTLPAYRSEWAQTDGHLALKLNGDVLWQLNFGEEAAKPFFDPLAVVGGPLLTWNAPPDHPWHHGLWFSWKFINGVNFWEEDPKTGRAAGVTTWDPPKIATQPDGTADVRFRLRYEAEPGKTVLTERRRLTISPPNREGAYAIDWASVFEAQAPQVLLDRTPIAGEPDGKAWGGYAGLSMRFSKMTNPEACSDAAPLVTDCEVLDLDAEALDYSGVIDQQTCGLAIVQHANTAPAATPWYVITNPNSSFYYFSPALLYRSPRNLKHGEKLTLRYRIVVHPDRWDSPRLREELTQFSKTAP